MSETELKFEVSPADLKRLLRHQAFESAGERTRLATVYYDTPEFDLRAAAVSLRVRKSGETFIQTLKRVRRGELFERDEWETETASNRLNLSLFDGTPAAELLAEHALTLRPQFTVRVERTVRLFKDDDTTIELAIDRGEIRAGERREPICELELELKAGDVQRLYALAEDMAASAPLRLSFEAKSDRGYRLVENTLGEPRKAEPLDVEPDMTTAQAFGCIARACLVQLAGNAQALRRERRPESLHQARIALRRLRSALNVFKSMLRDDAYEWVKGELKWAAGEFDQARNLDVFIAAVEGAAGEDRLMTIYLDRLRAARERAYDAALQALDSPRFAQLLLKTALWVQTGPWLRDPSAERAGLRDEPLPVFAARVLEGRRRRVRRGGKALHKLDPEVRHQLRIDGKKLRYAAEFFEGAFPEAEKRRRRFVGALKSLQDQLGELNDIAVAADTAKLGVFGGRKLDLAFAAGEVVGRMRAREGKLMDRAIKAYEAFRDARPFWEADEI